MQRPIPQRYTTWRDAKIPGLGVVAILVAIGLAVGCQTVHDEERPLITRLKGAVRYSKDDGNTWRPLKKNNVLLPGVVLQTETNSHVALSLGVKAGPRQRGVVSFHGTRELALRLEQSSILRIDKLAMRQASRSTESVVETRLELRMGSLLCAVPNTTEDSIFKINFTNGIARVRRGLFKIDASGSTRVLEGSVNILMSNTNLVREITNGLQFDASTGRTTNIPNYFYFRMSH